MDNTNNSMFFSTRALGNLKILAYIDNYALIEKMYDTPEKYIIASGFDMESKSWNFGSYYTDFKEVLEDFTDKVLNGRGIKSSKEIATDKLYELGITMQELTRELDSNAIPRNVVYPDNMSIDDIKKIDEEIRTEMDKLRKEFEEITLNDPSLVEHFKNTNSENSFSSITVAGTILGGIDLRNLQREHNNLDGEIEEYPYNKEQIKMIDTYYNLQKRLDKLEEYVETNMKIEDEEELEYDY